MHYYIASWRLARMAVYFSKIVEGGGEKAASNKQAK
jgi:hypothetical protein